MFLSFLLMWGNGTYSCRLTAENNKVVRVDQKSVTSEKSIFKINFTFVWNNNPYEIYKNIVNHYQIRKEVINWKDFAQFFKQKWISNEKFLPDICFTLMTYYGDRQSQRFVEFRQFPWTLKVKSIPKVMKFKYKIQYLTKTIHEFSESNWFSNFWELKVGVEWLRNRAIFCSVNSKPEISFVSK